jgi:peroxiredoxin
MKTDILNKLGLIFSAFAFFFSLNSYAGNELQPGDPSPNPEFTPYMKYVDDAQPTSLYDFKEGKIMLVAFMTTLSGRSNYAKVMTDAFDTYFAEGLAFKTNNDFYSNPEINLNVLVITQDNTETVKNFINNHEMNFYTAPDRNMNLANLFGIKNFESDKAGSYVFIIDKENKIAYSVADFKGEGEKLKSLQAQLYTMLDIKTEMSPDTYLPLMTGDKAWDFEFDYVNGDSYLNTENAKLSDYFGKKNVLIAFYPAPYSYSCAAEIVSLDRFAEEKKLLENLRMNAGTNPLQNDPELEILMVSVSNNAILVKWKNDSNLQNVKLANDFNGEISAKYNSYDAFGYNKRTMFLVNKEGIVSFIDWDYDVEKDFASLKEEISSLN